MANPSLKFFHVSEWPTTGQVQGGIYFNKTAGAVRVWDGSAWETYSGVLDVSWDAEAQTLTFIREKGTSPVVFDMSGLATKTYVDAQDAATLTSANSTAEAKANTAQANAQAYTDTEIGKLDATKEQTADASNGGLTLKVVEEDGKITSISGSIADNTYDAYGAATTAEANAKSYADAKDVTTLASAKSYADGIKTTVDAYKVNGIAISTNPVLDGADIKLDGYEKASTSAAVAATDTVNEAIGKLEKSIEAVGGDAVALVEAGDGINVSAKVDHKQTVSAKIKDGEKILAADSTGLSTTLTINYDSAAKKISLKGIGGAPVSEIDATDFIKDGILYDQIVATATGTSMEVTFPKGDKNTFIDLEDGKPYLFLEFNDGLEAANSKSFEKVALESLVDTYTAGDGLDLDDHEFSVKIDAASEGYLTVGEDGVKLAGVDAAIAAAVSTETARAKAAEQANATAISNEVTRAEAAEQANATAISNEVTARINGDNEINAKIGSGFDSTNTVAKAITTNTTAISTEVARAEGVENSILALHKDKDGAKMTVAEEVAAGIEAAFVWSQWV